MSRNHKKEKQNERMELKYCEHCGGLWVREPGAGVYCAKCEPKVADLPVPRKKPARVMLPHRHNNVAVGMSRGMMNEPEDMETVGGVA